MKNQAFERWYFKNPHLRPDEPEDCIENYKKIEFIDKGGVGRVEKYVRTQDDLKVAIKSIFKRDIHPTERKLIESELKNMYRIDHPNIIKLISHFEDNDRIFIVTELCSLGNLHKFQSMQEQRKFDERLAVFFLKQIINAIDYLHSQTPPIIHRDIKPENILLDDNHVVKLIDFGSSKAYEQSVAMQTQTGTPIYMAPEIVSIIQQTEKVDMWTLGVLIFEFLSGETPFYDRNNPNQSLDQIKQNILKNEIKFPEQFPPLAKGLVLMLLNANPQKRPTIQRIKEDPWLKSFEDGNEEIFLRASFPSSSNVGGLQLSGPKVYQKNTNNICSILKLKISEKSSMNFEKEKRDMKQLLKESINKIQNEIVTLTSKITLQRQQSSFLISFIENNFDKIKSDHRELFHPRTVTLSRKEQEEFEKNSKLLEEEIKKKSKQLKKAELSIKQRKAEIDQKLFSEKNKLEKARNIFASNETKISQLQAKIVSLEQEILTLNAETNIDINQEEEVNEQDQRRRESIDSTQEFERHQRDLLQGVRSFLNIDFFSNDEQQLKDQIIQLEAQSSFIASQRLEKQKNGYQEQLREISDQETLDINTQKKKYEHKLQELQETYEKEMSNNQNGLLLKKQLEGCLEEIQIKLQIREVLEGQKKINIDKQKLQLNN